MDILSKAELGLEINDLERESINNGEEVPIKLLDSFIKYYNKKSKLEKSSSIFRKFTPIINFRLKRIYKELSKYLSEESIDILENKIKILALKGGDEDIMKNTIHTLYIQCRVKQNKEKTPIIEVLSNLKYPNGLESYIELEDFDDHDRGEVSLRIVSKKGLLLKTSTKKIPSFVRIGEVTEELEKERDIFIKELSINKVEEQLGKKAILSDPVYLSNGYSFNTKVEKQPDNSYNISVVIISNDTSKISDIKENNPINAKDFDEMAGVVEELREKTINRLTSNGAEIVSKEDFRRNHFIRKNRKVRIETEKEMGNKVNSKTITLPNGISFYTTVEKFYEDNYEVSATIITKEGKKSALEPSKVNSFEEMKVIRKKLEDMMKEKLDTTNKKKDEKEINLEANNEGIKRKKKLLLELVEGYKKLELSKEFETNKEEKFLSLIEENKKELSKFLSKEKINSLLLELSTFFENISIITFTDNNQSELDEIIKGYY